MILWGTGTEEIWAHSRLVDMFIQIEVCEGMIIWIRMRSTSFATVFVSFLTFVCFPFGVGSAASSVSVRPVAAARVDLLLPQECLWFRDIHKKGTLLLAISVAGSALPFFISSSSY
jgi:hypothetical protein